MTFDFSQLPADCDDAYEYLHGWQETPSQFRVRHARGGLTEMEAEAIDGCETDNERFAVTHPDYVSRDAFRVDWFAQKEAEAAAAVPAVENEDDGGT